MINSSAPDVGAQDRRGQVLVHHRLDTGVAVVVGSLDRNPPTAAGDDDVTGLRRVADHVRWITRFGSATATSRRQPRPAESSRMTQPHPSSRGAIFFFGQKRPDRLVRVAEGLVVLVHDHLGHHGDDVALDIVLAQLVEQLCCRM